MRLGNTNMGAPGKGSPQGVVGMASVGLGTSSSGSSVPGDAAAWTWVIFGLAVFFLLFVHMGFGGFRGSVAS